MNIMILKIPRNVESPELEKLFTQFGPVDSCEIIMDEKTKTSKGFGFVEMENITHANNAIKELNGYQLGNQKLRVKVAAPK